MSSNAHYPLAPLASFANAIATPLRLHLRGANIEKWSATDNVDDGNDDDNYNNTDNYSNNDDGTCKNGACRRPTRVTKHWEKKLQST